MLKRFPPTYVFVLPLLLATVTISAAEAPSEDEARAAMRKAATFFHGQVSIEGGYLWRYAADLSLHEGEGKAYEDTAWVQPPGTPSVGQVYLRAYERTADALCLDAAVATGHALVKGQLASGGWDYRIEFAPERRKKYAYRVAPNAPGGRNVTTLDDDTTQAALRFLMALDKTLDFGDSALHDCALSALDALLEAQYPNGAWPQRFSAPPNPAAFPVKRASYPETWSRTFPSAKYQGYYTFNDNTLADIIDTFFDAERIYGGGRYEAAAKRGGDFILLSQMPEPQPAWAQQYDADMHPAWARKFEPPSVTGGESQGILRALIRLYERTGDEKYIEPVPRALAYLEASLRPDGMLARFYELETNRPLYFTLDYKLTYSDADMPTHYGFVTGSRLDSIEAAYQRALDGEKEGAPRPAKRASLAKQVRELIAAMDARGAWPEQGTMKNYPEAGEIEVLDCRTFIHHLDVLSSYIAAEE